MGIGDGRTPSVSVPPEPGNRRGCVASGAATRATCGAAGVDAGLGRVDRPSAPARIPGGWLDAAHRERRDVVPGVLCDPPGAFPPVSRRSGIEPAYARAVRKVRRRVLPRLTGWGLAF